MYNFGGETFLQLFGGPIGARLTMAIARLVMQQWREDFEPILERSNIVEYLKALYVDDGRSVQRKLFLGERFVEKEKRIVYSEENKIIDLERNVSREELTREEMIKTMNSVNPDLKFTMELVTDFEENRLPTLSFTMWPGERKIFHSYFEKSMKNQVLMMEKSSIGRQAMMSIMSNEMRRRLEVMDHELPTKEKIRVIDMYTAQLVNSGYNWKQIRDIVVSALLRFVRREKRKENEGRDRYYSGQQSLQKREMKKLTEKTTWFRRRKGKEDRELTRENTKENSRKESDIRKIEVWHQNQEKNDEIEENSDQILTPDLPKAVLFVPSTEDSKLAKEIRAVIRELQPWTGISIKVVERAGEKLEEVLHKSDPWENVDCQRENCKPCKSSYSMEKPKFKNCKRRSIVYKVWCKTCKKESEEKRNKNKSENKNKRKREEMDKGNEETFTYIGETSRSAMERGEEHLKDLEFRRSKSHMLKHIVMYHGESEPEKIDFAMEILSSHRSSFERQIREAVLIERMDGPYSMNSKLEYSRTVIPKIKMKMGNRIEKEDPKIIEEKNVIEKIKELKTILDKRKREQTCRENGENVDFGMPRYKCRKIVSEPEFENVQVAKTTENMLEKNPKCDINP